jgi:uncharacterized RDD family membrane protein YckC
MEPDNTAASQPRYGGFWVRVGAFLIDSLVLLPLLVLLLRWAYGPHYFSDNPSVQQLQAMWAAWRTGSLLDPATLLTLSSAAATADTGLADTLIGYGAPAVFAVSFWLLRRGTPGKLWLGLEVVDASTLGRLGVGQSVGRYLGYFVSLIPFGLGLLWVGLDPKKQGWHDKLAGTLVIHKAKSP